MVKNTTGTIIGTLDVSTLREILLNYKGSNDAIKRLLLNWYDEAKKLESLNEELIISKPEGF